MKALRQPSDPARRVKEFLAQRLAERGDPATADSKLPKNWQPHNAPAVVVFDDGGDAQWPVSTSPTIRVTVWADGRTRAREIAGWCMGWLLCLPVPGVANISSPTALIDAQDEHNSGRMAGFTVRAKARTIPL